MTAGAAPVLNLCPVPVTLASGHYITEVPIDVIPNLLLQWHKHQQRLKQAVKYKTRWVQADMTGRLVGCSYLARDLARLQETLMDGVLQKLLVVVGHGRVSAATPTVVTGRHLEHWGTHSKWRESYTGERETGWDSQKCKYLNTQWCTVVVKEAAFLPAASSSSPVDVGVAAGVVFTSSSVLHLLTFPNVILAFSTWNRGISAREESPADGM